MHITLMFNSVLPVSKYGGIQRDVIWLTKEFIRMGHSVAVIARPGSYAEGAEMIFANSKAEAFTKVPKHTDIVNVHDGPPPADFAFPCLISAHGNGFVPDDRNWSFVSANHAKRFGRETFVYNGVPKDETYYSSDKSDRFLFFSRINREGKNISKAMDIALKHDLELDIAGGSRRDLLMRSVVRRERAFFKSLAPNFTFHGLVGGWEKAALFAHAKALLFPIRWEEPFGLVVIESLLAGTPVITTGYGAMPELMDPEVGFICENDADYDAAIAQVDTISPARCREYAAEHFSMEQSANGYLALYERILNGEKLR